MSYDLELSRELYVPRELVFDVWTDAAHLSAWYAPPGGEVESASVSAEAGGTLELSCRGPDGARVMERGEYLSVRRPEGFSCRVRYTDSFVPLQTRLEVHLEDLGGACRITLAEQGCPQAALRDAQRCLWERRLDQLEAYFTSI